MARYIGPVCRLCRREGMKLFLKGERCYTQKARSRSATSRRGSTARRASRRLPATAFSCVRSRRSSAPTGCSRIEFRRYFEADRTDRGITGETLLQLLERRLDNVVYRIGLSTSRPQARQLVRHGHFLVNGKKVDIPSLLAEGGRRGGGASSRSSEEPDASARDGRGERPRRSGVAAVRGGLAQRQGGSLPTREQINLPVQEQLIVELYSK